MNPRRREIGLRKAKKVTDLWYFGSGQVTDETREWREKETKKMWKCRKRCSCMGCSRTRRRHYKSDKLTMQEKRQLEADQMDS